MNVHDTLGNRIRIKDNIKEKGKQNRNARRQLIALQSKKTIVIIRIWLITIGLHR